MTNATEEALDVLNDLQDAIEGRSSLATGVALAALLMSFAADHLDGEPLLQAIDGERNKVES